MLQVLLTLGMIGIIIYAILKKYNVATSIFIVSILCLVGYSIITSSSPLGEETIGNVILDNFEFLNTTMQAQLAGNVLVIMTIIGYVGFMNRIKASEAFTILVSEPLQRVKNPYILASLLIITGALLKLVIPSAMATVSLLFATLYPVLLRCGVSKATIASGLVCSTIITWGPADGGVILTASIAAPDISVTDFFLDHHLAIAGSGLIIMAIVFNFTSRYFDKKDNAKGLEEKEDESKSLDELGVPLYYAILPSLPLISIILFSGKVTKITMTPVAATLLALFVALAVHVLSNIKDVKSAFNDIDGFYDSAGNAVKIGYIVIAGVLFSQAIGRVGGMDIIVESLNNLGGGVVLLSIVGSIIAVLVTGATVSYMANLNIFVPFFVSISNVTGFNTATLGALANSATGLGTGLTPASGAMLFISDACGVPVTTIIKRNVIPIIATLIAMIIATFIF